MNIFALDTDPAVAAKMHCDKHVCKMVIEYAQLMSTAHRMLDGELYNAKTASNRNIKRWRLEDEREALLYKASHINHPSAIWVRETDSNYLWMYELFRELCSEYTYRYNRTHLTEKKLLRVLRTPPEGIRRGSLSTIPLAMPDYCKLSDTVESYRNYYIKEKKSFVNWKKREIPYWFSF